MKIKKYGYCETKPGTELVFAVMILKTRKFVTDIETYPHRIWKAEDGKPAFIWDKRKAAQDFVIQLAYRDYLGVVVEFFKDVEVRNK